MDKIEFMAAMYPRGTAVGRDAEGEGFLKVAIPASEAGALVLLMAATPGKLWRMTVEEAE